MNEVMKKATLLLLPVPSSMMVALLSASLLQIYAEYPQYSETLVTMVLTIPNLTVMLGLVLAPVLLRKYPIKHLIIAGLSLFIISSILPIWCEGFYLLLLLRALSGVGCGIVLPMQATFLATYPDRERAGLMGLGATVSCLVAAAVVSISGIIAVLNWRNVFYLYLINIIVLIMAVLFLPRNLETGETHLQKNAATQEEKTDASAVKSKKTIGEYKHVLCTYYFLLAGSYLFVSVLSAEIGPYLESTKLGGPGESGIMMSISLVGSMFAGMFLSRYIRILKSYSIMGVFFGATIGFALLWFAPTVEIVGVAAFLIGGFSALVSCVVNYEMSCILPLTLYTTAAAGVSFFTFVLQFISPMVFLAVLDILPGGSVRTVFLIYAIIQFLFMIIAYLLQKIINPKIDTMHEIK